MGITNFPRSVWLHMQRPNSRSSERSKQARKSADEPGSDWVALGAMPTRSPIAAPLAPALWPMSPPQALQRPAWYAWTDVSRLAEHSLSGRLQQQPRKDRQADVLFREALSVTLCRADTPVSLRIGAINNLLRRLPNLMALCIGLDLQADEVGELELDLVPRLRLLDLRYNPFGDAGAKALRLECLPDLERLTLAGCALSMQGLADLRLDCTSIAVLDVRVNHAIDGEAAMEILRHKAPRLQAVIVDAPSNSQARAVL